MQRTLYCGTKRVYPLFSFQQCVLCDVRELSHELSGFRCAERMIVAKSRVQRSKLPAKELNAGSGTNLKRRRGAVRARRVEVIKLNSQQGEHKESRKCTMHKLASCAARPGEPLRLLNATLHSRTHTANCRLTLFP